MSGTVELTRYWLQCRRDKAAPRDGSAFSSVTVVGVLGSVMVEGSSRRPAG
jgi:hypothetical protein